MERKQEVVTLSAFIKGSFKEERHSCSWVYPLPRGCRGDEIQQTAHLGVSGTTAVTAESTMLTARHPFVHPCRGVPLPLLCSFRDGMILIWAYGSQNLLSRNKLLYHSAAVVILHNNLTCCNIWRKQITARKKLSSCIWVIIHANNWGTVPTPVTIQPLDWQDHSSCWACDSSVSH